MKFTVPIILCSLGFFIGGFGYLFRIMHWPGAMLALLLGGLLLAIGLIVLIVALAKDAGENSSDK